MIGVGLRRFYQAFFIVIAIVTILSINYFHIGDLVQLNEVEIKNDAALPYPYIRFEVSNQGDKDITAIRARVNDVDLPYTFGVSKDHPLESSRIWNYHEFTAWYESGGSVGGYNPNFGDWYRIKVTLLLNDGSTKVCRKIGRYIDSHEGSLGTLGGFDTLSFRGASLLASEAHGTLNLNFLNDWVVESAQTVKRLEIRLDDMIVWEEDVRVDHTRDFAVTVEIPFELESGKKYDVTLIAYSTEGNISTFTESTLCQKYELGN